MLARDGAPAVGGAPLAGGGRAAEARGFSDELDAAAGDTSAWLGPPDNDVDAAATWGIKPLDVEEWACWGRRPFCWFGCGAAKFVDRLMMSLP